MPIIPVPSPVLERAGLLTEEDKNSDPKTAVRGYGACTVLPLLIEDPFPLLSRKTGPGLAWRYALVPHPLRRHLTWYPQNVHNRKSNSVAYEDETEKTFKFNGLEVVNRWK